MLLRCSLAVALGGVCRGGAGSSRGALLGKVLLHVAGRTKPFSGAVIVRVMGGGAVLQLPRVGW